jgi:predicted RNA-binding Zn-ribbon protein involved in translation (DUF1610 family)
MAALSDAGLPMTTKLRGVHYLTSFERASARYLPIAALLMPAAIVLCWLLGWLWAVPFMQYIFTTVFSIWVVVLFAVRSRSRRALREARFELCARCGYPFSGESENFVVCPECGSENERRAVVAQWQRSYRWP